MLLLQSVEFRSGRITVFDSIQRTKDGRQIRYGRPGILIRKIRGGLQSEASRRNGPRQRHAVAAGLNNNRWCNSLI